MAEALVGGAFLSATLQVLFDRIASRRVLDFVRGRKISDAPFKKLKMKLLAVNVVLNDAEEKQFTDPLVKEWLNELKHAIYDAEDLVDGIVTEANLQFKLEPEACASKDQVCNISSTFYSIDGEMETKIEEILDRLEYIEQEKDILGLKQVIGRRPSRRLPSTSLVEESGVYGRDRDKEKIFELLSLDGVSADEISVITILGMGGVGKTTLAQLVYNDGKLNDQFDMKAWVCVSEDFGVSAVTKTILEAVTFSACDIKDMNLLQLKLKESLTGKKFLLVLDDVWNEDYNDWDVLQRPFRYGAKGSKVIVTTQSENVACIMGRGRAHHLNKLSDEDCWLLFAKHAFDNKFSSENQELEGIGRKIVAKCSGLPLAAKALGGLLRSKGDVADWYKVLNSEFWELRSGVVSALRLSYHYLPSNLKRCFAYCSIFPKDYEFEKQQVILLWMAEGLLQHQQGSKQMEQVGAEYFDDLISRSLFQQSSQHKTRFFMHGLVNDLANIVSGEFFFRLEDDNLQGITEKTRHLSYVQKTYDAFRKFDVLSGTKHLRTFLPLRLSPHWAFDIGDKVPNELLPALRCLRVLSLSRCDKIKELPNSIGGLRHLRYMDLSRTAIKKLPDSTSNLSNLQTLLLSCCKSLIELPTNMGRLTNLRHLDVRGTELQEMPMHMSRLSNLQTLSTYIVSKHNGSTIMELREHNNLQGALSILKLENVVSVRDAIEANLKDKMHLDEILFQWSPGTEEDSVLARDVLEKLQPQKKLKKLNIKHYGSTRFPDWLGDHSFSNMVFLCLSHCKYCFFLPPLGQLPSLRELIIVSFDEVTVVGPEFYEDGSSTGQPFGSLEILKFKNMSKWDEWFCPVDEGCSFPSLRELFIENCPKLKGSLPNHLPSLTNLVISRCQQLAVSFPRAPRLCKVDLAGIDTLLSIGNDNVPLQSEVQPSSWSCLKTANILGVLNLKEFPPGLMQSLAIEELTIWNCPSLESFPMSGLPSTLNYLNIEQCEMIDLLLPGPDYEIQISDYSSSSLEKFFLRGSCNSLKSFPLGLFPQLNDLQFCMCANLTTLFIPVGVHNNLTSLTELAIEDCPKFVSFPQEGLPMCNLTSLEISDCMSLKSLPQQMHSLLPSLQRFVICDCPELESFPEGGLPSNLGSLSIHNCNKLQCLPEDCLPKSLSTLIIQSCQLLNQRCRRDNGEDWPKIAQIPNIMIDFEVLSSCKNSR